MGTGARSARRPTTLTAIVAFVLAAAPAAGGATALRATTTVAPQEVFFGDPVSAVVTARFERGRVDPGTVSIDLRTAPFARLAPPRLRRSASSVSLVVRLACLSARCLPRPPRRTIGVGPALVRYREDGRERVVTVGRLQLLVASRLTASDVRRPRLRSRLDPPPASGGGGYLGWGLVAGAGICLLAGLAGIVRRVRPPAPATEPEPLTAALAEVESLAEQADEARRRAIDRLATALDDAGLRRLVPQARTLAWSRRAPSAEPMRRLVRTVERFRRAA